MYNMSVLCLQLVFSAASWPKKLSKGGQRDGKEPQQDDMWGKKRDEIKEELGIDW